MRFSIDVGSELELKLYQAVLLYKNDHGNRYMATRPRRRCSKTAMEVLFLVPDNCSVRQACGS